MATNEAAAIARKWVARLGLGFHPDTPGADYVNERGEPSFSVEQAAEYDRDIDRLFELPGDPYEHGLRAMREAYPDVMRGMEGEGRAKRWHT